MNDEETTIKESGDFYLPLQCVRCLIAFQVSIYNEAGFWEHSDPKFCPGCGRKIVEG